MGRVVVATRWWVANPLQETPLRRRQHGMMALMAAPQPMTPTEQAAILRRKLYRRAIPLTWAWFLLVGVVAGDLSGRLRLTLPASIAAAIVLSVWMIALGRRNIASIESGARPPSRRRNR
jgi:hypothetical protein